MPKGGVHHLHLTAAAHIDFLIELTYEDYVYFSEREKMFKVSKDNPPLESGYIKCNDLRQFRAKSEELDHYFKEKILLTKEDASSQESEEIWDLFQFKFIMTNDLYNYAPFFERIVMKIFETCVEEHIYICELRHIVGFVFDDQRNSIDLEKEMEIFDRCIKNIQKTVPNFACKIIICGLKALGKEHVQREIDDTLEGLQN